TTVYLFSSSIRSLQRFVLLSLSSIFPLLSPTSLFLFFFNDPAPTEIYTLSLHDALPIWACDRSTTARPPPLRNETIRAARYSLRSEEHTSELQSLTNLVCRLLLEKKKKTKTKHRQTKY